MMDIAGGAVPFQDVLVAAVTALTGNNSVNDNRLTFVQRLAAKIMDKCVVKKESGE